MRVVAAFLDILGGHWYAAALAAARAAIPARCTALLRSATHSAFELLAAR